MWAALLPDKTGLNFGVHIFGCVVYHSDCFFFSKYIYFFLPASEAKLMDFSFSGCLFYCMNIVLSLTGIFTPVCVCIFF